MSAAKTKAQNLINENGVVVFSKSYCPYCKSSKDLLNKLGAKFEVLELDQIGEFCYYYYLLLSFAVIFCVGFGEGEGKSFAICAGNDGGGVEGFPSNADDATLHVPCTSQSWLGTSCYMFLILL
jgi:thiol-disulfide isomerase/thioredoxin